MGMFDFKGNFPSNALIEAAISKRKGEEEARLALAKQIQRQQEIDLQQQQQTIENVGTVANNLNKHQMNRQMAQTLSNNDSVQDYLHQTDPMERARPVTQIGGRDVTFGRTASGGVGMPPAPSMPRTDAKGLQPFIEAGKGPELLEKAADYNYKMSNVEDVIPVYGPDGKSIIRYDRVTRKRGGRTTAPARPPQPRGGGTGKSERTYEMERLVRVRDQVRKSQENWVPAKGQTEADNPYTAVMAQYDTILNRDFGVPMPEKKTTKYASPAEVKAAMDSGKLKREDAKAILLKDFGMK